MHTNVRAAVAALAGTTALCSTLVVGVGSTAVADDAPAWCATTGELLVEDLPDLLPAHPGCDLTGRVIRNGEVTLAVPAPGHGVGYEGYGAGGRELAVTAHSDGSVEIGWVDEHEPNPITGPAPTTPESKDPCLSTLATAYSKLGFKAYTTLNWYYNGASAPTSVASTALSAVDSAALNMADGHDDCGISEIPRDSFHEYKGATTRTPAVTSTCGTNDTYSVVGWGTLSGSLAAACSWWTTEVSPWRRTATDIKINTSYSWTTNVTTCIGTGNIGSYDVESVMTHEWGHGFGLGHVNEEGATGSQTMSTNSDGTCQRAESTLGRGDLNGMFSLYGKF